MGTTTSRLGLYKPTPVGEQVDISLLNNNADVLDEHAHYFECTSGTRPATPFAGQAIFETDTKLTYIWDGAGWRFLAGSAVLRLRRNATQSIPTGASLTNISFDTEDEDTHSIFTPTGTDITVPTGLGGLWVAHGLVRFNAFTSNNASAAITVDGVNVLDGPSALNQGAGLGVQAAVDGFIRVTSGQVIRMGVRQESGGSVSCTARLQLSLEKA